MKILFLCPTNPKYMPYLDNYLTVLNEFDVDFNLLIWDRFGIEKNEKNFIFRRGENKHQRGFLDYYYYSKFIEKHISENSYDKIICFGLQTAFFIKNILCSKFFNKFVLDIRDYNTIKKFYNFKKVISCSSCTVISSKGYIKWLPESDKYIVNHNFNFRDLSGVYDLNEKKIKKLSISSIGALRDLKINVDFVYSLKNSSSINVNFHGRGDINSVLLSKTKGCENVYITGFYDKSEEAELYANSHLINVLRYPDSLNNITALPNRLYLAPYYGKPLFAFRGTYMSELIEFYNLGLVVDSFKDLEVKIIDYIENFNFEKFNLSRLNFLNNVVSENLFFESSIRDFVSKI